MTIGAIILARLTSNRLPGKGLRRVAGKEIIKHIFDSLQMCHHVDKIIVGTSLNAEDDDLERFCEKHSIICYRGSLNNVAERFLNAAIDNKLTRAIRINGDNLFVNPELVDTICLKAMEGFEFVSNVPGHTYPRGMSVELIETSLYADMYREFKDLADFEHVTSYLYQNDSQLNKKYFINKEIPDAASVQLAIDTQYDFNLATDIFDLGFEPAYSLDLKSLTSTVKLLREKMNFIGKNGPLLIAEIGGNHEGNFEYAKVLTQLAIESNADFVKFQMYTGNTLVNSLESPSRHKHFKKFELSREQYVELAQMVNAAGKQFMASIWDISMVDWVDDYNPIYKVGSGDLLAWPLLEELASRGKPMILSTGLATEEEVIATVEYLRRCNSLYNDSNYLAVLQCTSMYPIPKSAANLSVMSRLKDVTGATIGYSDHTEGAVALKTAVAMGAQVLEFHFTDDRNNKEFRDHKVSLTKDEVLDLIETIKTINVLKGSEIKQPVSIEIENGHLESFRRAIYPAKNLPLGHIVVKEDFRIMRPSHGLSSRFLHEIIGMKTTRSLSALEKISLEDFCQ